MSKLKLNIGCGGDLREGYVNIDMHTKDDIVKRYGAELNESLKIHAYDIFNLPYEDNTVDEILCLGMMEHLSFVDEGLLFKEIKRILKSGGTYFFTVPNFEVACKQFLEAKDDFKDFYRIGTDEHWFGQGNRNTKNRWGYLTCVFFGNQDGDGQFHRNAYTTEKIRSILKMLDFTEDSMTFPRWKDTDTWMIHCRCHKN